VIDTVDSTHLARRAAPLKRSGKAADAAASPGFSAHLPAENAASAPALSGTTPLSGMAALLGIQEVEDAVSRALRGKKRAQKMLDVLNRLRDGLLAGAVNPDCLHMLAADFKSERPQVEDPALAQLLDAVDLRVQVELAKYSR